MVNKSWTIHMIKYYELKMIIYIERWPQYISKWKKGSSLYTQYDPPRCVYGERERLETLRILS